LEDNHYGFKTKDQGILLSDIGEINKMKKKDDEENIMADKEYYDQNLNTDTIVFTNLIEEADIALAELTATTKDLKKISAANPGQAKKIKKAIKEKLIVGRMKKVSYNVKSDIDTFVSCLVQKDIIKSVMIFIEES